MAASNKIGFGGYYTPYNTSWEFPGFIQEAMPSINHRGKGIDYSQDGLYCAMSFSSVGLKVWNVADWSEVVIPVPYADTANDVNFSPDSQYLIVAGEGAPYLVMFETTGWTRVAISGVNNSFGFSCDWSLDGNYFAFGHNSNISPGYQVFDAGTLTAISGWPVLPAGAVQVMDIAISERSDVVVACNVTSDPAVSVVDLQTQSILWSVTESLALNSNQAKPLALSPDGDTLAVANQTSPYMYMYDARTGDAVVGPTGGDLPTVRATSAAYSIDGVYLCLGNWSSTRVTYWDTDTWAKTDYSNALIGDAILAVSFNGSEGVVPPAAAGNPVILGTNF